MWDVVVSGVDPSAECVLGCVGEKSCPEFGSLTDDLDLIAGLRDHLSGHGYEL